MTYKHTPSDHLQVVIHSTCSGAWPGIVERCQNPETQELWLREIGGTETAFVEKPGLRARGMPGTYNEKPQRFEPTDESEEAIANAHLWAQADAMLKALRKASKVITDLSMSHIGFDLLDAEIKAVITKATTITDMKGGD